MKLIKVENNLLNEGQKVLHRTYGEGIITKVIGSTLSVDFTNTGIKLVEVNAVLSVNFTNTGIKLVDGVAVK